MYRDNIAHTITEAMATWRFILIFLALCLIEIWLNHVSWIPVRFQFDPQTIILNLFLSLIAAIQGSIIMIDQRQADAKRDAILKWIKEAVTNIFKLEEKILRQEKQHTKFEKEMIARLDRQETLIRDLQALIREQKAG